MEPIRILIVDDHTLFREGVLAILKGEADFDAVGEAATGREAIQQAERLSPDVVLMDIQMPDMNGIEATQAILRAQPNARIIMVTMLEDSEFLLAAMRAGARGYILKGADKQQMLQSIRTVAGGQAIFGPAVADRLAEFFLDARAPSRQAGTAKIFPSLTDREHEILDLIAAGKNNQEIANQLHIVVKTVSNHISSIFSKLEVADRAQAIVLAKDAGLGESGVRDIGSSPKFGR
ncbi:MAG: response regulator transcription factor [Candidatus Promineifilaceae bacterium]|nr:response regulator transcription factor [Candidatus Promineifilaceae bacterium]